MNKQTRFTLTCLVLILSLLLLGCTGASASLSEDKSTIQESPVLTSPLETPEGVDEADKESLTDQITPTMIPKTTEAIDPTSTSTEFISSDLEKNPTCTQPIKEPTTTEDTLMPADQWTGETELPPKPAGDTGKVPVEIMNKIYADLEARTGVNRSAFQVLKAEPVTWRDGSLGCPQKGEFYIQALIPGYQVVIEVGGGKYDYRVNDAGYFKLCQGMVSPDDYDSGKLKRP